MDREAGGSEQDVMDWSGMETELSFLQSPISPQPCWGSGKGSWFLLLQSVIIVSTPACVELTAPEAELPLWETGSIWLRLAPRTVDGPPSPIAHPPQAVRPLASLPRGWGKLWGGIL